jgi:hypothetical protein
VRTGGELEAAVSKFPSRDAFPDELVADSEILSVEGSFGCRI